VKDLIEFIARSLVDEPDTVHVGEKERGGITRYELEVAPDDLGKVIGRQGRTATAIRKVAGAIDGSGGTRIDFVDVDRQR
jgi:uncharacterized protein